MTVKGHSRKRQRTLWGDTTETLHYSVGINIFTAFYCIEAVNANELVLAAITICSFVPAFEFCSTKNSENCLNRRQMVRNFPLLNLRNANHPSKILEILEESHMECKFSGLELFEIFGVKIPENAVPLVLFIPIQLLSISWNSNPVEYIEWKAPLISELFYLRYELMNKM